MGERGQTGALESGSHRRCQTLWDSDASATNTLKKLEALLRSHYSGSRQADKFKMELRLRRRGAGESLSALHQNIRRLMPLAHPTLQQEAHQAIACDYFIDAIDDADFALNVREHAPPTSTKFSALLSN